MLFNSYEFIFLFLPVVVAGYWLLGARMGKEAGIAWLVGMSLVYYGWWNVNYLTLIALSVFFNYFIGQRIIALKTRGSSRFIALISGVVLNLSLLGYFKYSNFFVLTVESMAKIDFNWQEVVLPIAISFFTFQQIAYLVDAYRREAQEYKFLNYCLFVTFFPQLIAGPIVHHKEMMPQFERLKFWRSPSARHLAIGLSIFSIGLFKKIVVADGISIYVQPVFAAAATDVPLSLFEAWSGALAFTFQLYFDFSGYSDMAIGLARMFGIRLPLNFNSPYKANNMIDFWRRWHMTLSRFLRDYLYFPLGGNRRGPMWRYINILVTMVLGGLWHGAGWTFVAWGAMHGTFLIVNHAWRALVGVSAEPSSWLSRGASRLLTFTAVVFAWAMFRADDLIAAQNMFEAMVGINGVALRTHYFGLLGPLGPVLADIGVRFEEDLMMVGNRAGIAMVAMLVVVWFMPNTQQIMGRYRPALETYFNEINRSRLRLFAWRPTVVWGVIVGGMAVVSVLFASRVNEFLYYQF